VADRTRLLTVRQVADRLGLVTADAVLRLIHRGDLPAANVSSGPGRPTWRIDPADLAAFIAARRTRPAVAGGRRLRRSQSEVIRFYE
jgi:excisionase family DNA binding protein